MGGPCSTRGTDGNSCSIFVGKPERRRPLGSRRWEDDNRINLRELEWEVVDWIYLAQDRDTLQALVNTVLNLRVP
jgi:hypothetical protein